MYFEISTTQIKHESLYIHKKKILKLSSVSADNFPQCFLLKAWDLSNRVECFTAWERLLVGKQKQAKRPFAQEAHLLFPCARRLPPRYLRRKSIRAVH